MLTPLQQRRVWDLWFNGEVRACYFADLSGRYRRLQRAATWLTLVLSSGATVTLVAHLPAGFDWMAAILAALTAVVSLWSLVAQHQQHAIDAADLHHRWATLAAESRRLWDDMHASDAAARLEALDARAAELSKAGTAFPVRPRLLDKWHNHVEARYATLPRAA
ncbi:MAG TPA: hypothetical protein VNM91_07585 [Dehalococcoidia bacterium]|nr:hypothetical protein [Dehalococcoidia bacterium]